MKAAFKRFVLFGILFVFLDRLCFDLLLFRIPPVAAWDTQGRFELERQLRSLPDAPSFVVLGSSVARYGLLPENQTIILSRNGLNPYELLALSERLDVRPGLFIVLVHPVDFRLERAAVRKREAFLDLYELSYVREIHPLTALYGAPYEKRPAALLSFLLSSYRYGGILRESLDTGSSLSYRNYQGIALRGVNRRGWLGPQFSLVLSGQAQKTGLILQLPQRIGEEVRLELSAEDNKRIYPLKKGWQTIPLNDWPAGTELRGTFSRSFSEDGVLLVARLPQWFGLTFIERFQEKSRLRILEDDLLMSMNADQVERFHKERQASLDGPGREYLQALALLRRDLARAEFEEGEPTFTLFRQAIRKLRKQAPVLVINVPENPLSLAAYGSSRWYSGFVDFLREGASCFADESQFLEARYFYDTHHLSYDGARKFTSRLSDLRQACLHAIGQ
ncbi:MAG: hypothetical protein HS115_19805 [Spirochaetales bacterium]|nr:hypothetical protein [Spirochaetales bacterium]